MSKTKILIVDDHNVIREGVRFMLDGIAGFQVIGEAANGSEALTLAEDLAPDIVIMDISMPVMDGIEATKQICAMNKKVKVLGLSMNDDEHNIVRMLEAGAMGYILKTTEREEMIAAVETLLDGSSYFSQEVSAKMMKRYMAPPGNSKDGVSTELTKREIEVLKHIAEGYSNSEVGEKLFISTRTVESHRRNIIQKLNVKNTAGLVRYAVEKGLVE